MLCDAASAIRQLEKLKRRGHHKKAGEALAHQLKGLASRLERSARERESRFQRKPALSYPHELPIIAERNKIVRSIRENRVVVISGETGCGKSTQIPKMCLEAGRGISGKIACTQPRRIAATTIAKRIAEELKENLGHSVGYKIRFRDTTPRDAYIKILTDGMLLAETQGDPGLNEYDTIIIDEAHERSLNIDFLLGITRNLLRHRQQLKVIITSATMDTEKFSKAFDHAPVITVGGRLFPVEVKYQIFEEKGTQDAELTYVDMAVKAVDDVKKRDSGDILVFMPTEQDIIETCKLLEGRRYPATTVLPLFARLPGRQQGRVYSVKGRKVVVSTNVAETSLTIPGIKYVIDTGLARIARYQPSTRTNSLPVSRISRSSADQRKGRCGRVKSGICIRLYSEEDYLSRPEYTLPEIQRSNLAEVVLRMIDLKLGYPMDFPFLDRPQPKAVKDAYDALFELGAIEKHGSEYELTNRGRLMARMPLDPRISRMLLEAYKEKCLTPVSVIASALSIRDPRERPPEKESVADRMHAPFKNPDSDFMTLLTIWNRYQGDWEKLDTQGKKRKFCREHFLSFPRMEEWTHIHHQIRDLLKELKMRPEERSLGKGTPEVYAGIHRSILSGYLCNIAFHKDKNIYYAAGGKEVMVFPGSTLFNKNKPWLVAAEMVRTSRLFARTAALIESGWLEALGGNLCRYSYSGARWDPRRGETVAKERVTLYGLEIVAGRTVAYGPVHPEKAHAIFVDALLDGRVKNPPVFLKENRELVRHLKEMEAKLRRRDLIVSREKLAAFYSRRLQGVFDVSGLQVRIKESGGEDFLFIKKEDVLQTEPDEKKLALFPDEMEVGGKSWKVSYAFSPGDENDGVSLKVSLSLLSLLSPELLEWGVPGLFPEKIEALVKGLPKRYRKMLVPVSETADIIVKEMGRKEPSLFKNLSRFVYRKFNVLVSPDEWAAVNIAPHLKMRIILVDPQGREVLSGRDVDMLKKKVEPSSGRVDVTLEKKTRGKWERTGLVSWDFEEIPEKITADPFNELYPALVPVADKVDLRLFKKREEARSFHVQGVGILLRRRFDKDFIFARRYLVCPPEYKQKALFFGGEEALENGMRRMLHREVFQKNLRTREEYEGYSGKVIESLFSTGHRLQEVTLRILDETQKLLSALRKTEQENRGSRAVLNICSRVREGMLSLVPRHFLGLYSLERFIHLPRYMEALSIRLERGKNDPEKDRKKAEQGEVIILRWKALSEEGETEKLSEREAALEKFRWMIEEYKVSLFAPELGTAFPVSAKRLMLKLKEVEEGQYDAQK
ncbi:MAG: ATP-dependent RNA helicase HrpA [Candidatus Aminicenantes bacterium]|nr:ATP-dependent RNA helicase HrpA [Candidatus Aminicenantes bacterium]